MIFYTQLFKLNTKYLKTGNSDIVLVCSTQYILQTLYNVLNYVDLWFNFFHYWKYWSIFIILSVILVWSFSCFISYWKLFYSLFWSIALIKIIQRKYTKVILSVYNSNDKEMFNEQFLIFIMKDSVKTL